MPNETPASSRRNGHQNGSARMDRLPPYSLESEQGVLGCILTSPMECIGICIERLPENGKVFYDLRNQEIFDIMLEIHSWNDPIDLITLQARLGDRSMLESVGGLAYLSGLQDVIPSAANLPAYIDIVIEKFLLRKTIHLCTDIVGQAYDYEGNVDELMESIERDILKLNNSRTSGEFPMVNKLVQSAISTIESYHQRQGSIGGIQTGFADFDKMTDGLHPGEMIVIAARPSMGKTSLAMNIAENVVLNSKLPVGVFSLEMTAESLVMRMLCSCAKANLRNIRDGFMSESDFPKLTGAAGRLAHAPLFIDATAGLSVIQLRARARRMWQQHGIKLFIIDYLQLLHSTTKRAQSNRQQEIADISNGIKSLAKELGVPVIVLSQLNRQFEKDKNRKPRLSDLRESGEIEQDADVVGLLYKPNSEEGEDNYDGECVNLLIAKQRNGPTGEVQLTFLKSYTRFENASRVSDEDVPNDYTNR